MTISLKSSSAIVLALGVLASPALADMDAAKAFLDKEIAGVSTLSRADQEADEVLCRCISTLSRDGNQSCFRNNCNARI